MATNTFRLQYLAKAAAGVPRDLVNTFVSAKLHPIKPTVLIYNCTWVCDARCTMCNNWKWGDRKSDMTLAQLEPVMTNPFWGAVENLNISGGRFREVLQAEGIGGHSVAPLVYRAGATEANGKAYADKGLYRQSATA